MFLDLTDLADKPQVCSLYYINAIAVTFDISHFETSGSYRPETNRMRHGAKINKTRGKWQHTIFIVVVA